MAVGTEVVAVRYEDIVADTPISVPYPVYEALDITVYYGSAPLTAVYNTDYTITLGDDFDTFTLTPAASLLTKINDLIAGDPTEENYITVRRRLGYLTDTTAAAVRYTPFTSREFERTVLRFQQIQEQLNRSLTLAPSFVGSQPLLRLNKVEPGATLIVNEDGTAIGVGPTAAQIEAAEQYAQFVVGIEDEINAVAANVVPINILYNDLVGENHVGTVAENINDVTNFASVYLGASATEPTTRTDGSALEIGDLYFDTSSNVMNVWEGVAWVPAAASSLGGLLTGVGTFGAAPDGEIAVGQFTTLFVWVNGSLLKAGSDYTQDGSSFTVTSPVEGDEWAYWAYQANDATDYYTKIETDDLLAGKADASDVINIKQYGAVPADIASASANASALRFAFDRAIEDGQAVIEIPAKTWYMDSKVVKTLASGGVTLQGAGRDVTVLRWTGADGGLDITYPDNGWWHTNPGSAVNFRDLSVVTDVAGGGTAIRINGRTLEGRPMPSTTFTNIGWRGTDASAYWNTGVDLIDTSITSFSDVWGIGSVANNTLGVHVSISSSDGTRDSVEHTFVNFHATYGNAGITASDHVEGIHVTNALMVGVGYGIYWDCPTTYESQLTIGQSHIYARTRCIFMRRVCDSQIADGNFLAVGNGGVGIELVECGNTTISPQTFALGASTIGIAISDDLGDLANKKTYIAKQVMRGGQTGILLSATSKNVTAELPLAAGTFSLIVNNGTDNRVVSDPHAVSFVTTLTGGSVSEVIPITLPSGRFFAKPSNVSGSLAVGYAHTLIYDYDSSSAANAVLILRRAGGGNITAGTVRVNVTVHQ